MERVHAHHLRDLTDRLRTGASQRAPARDLVLAGKMVQKFAQLTAEADYPDSERSLPESAKLAAAR